MRTWTVVFVFWLCWIPAILVVRELLQRLRKRDPWHSAYRGHSCVRFPCPECKRNRSQREA